ncbi:MAG: restriction endonuclease subunit S [Weeksellaceae bacterium]
MKKQLKDICRIQPGIHIKSSEFEKGGKSIFIKLNDVPLGNVNTYKFTFTNFEVDDRFIIKEEDILFSTRIKFQAYHLPQHTKHPYIASSSFVILRPFYEIILKDYLIWYLNLPNISNIIHKQNASGANMPFISIKNLKQLDVDLPPLNVQKEIVKIHALQMQERNLTQKILSLKQTYLQSILLNKVQQ